MLPRTATTRTGLPSLLLTQQLLHPYALPSLQFPQILRVLGKINLFHLCTRSHALLPTQGCCSSNYPLFSASPASSSLLDRSIYRKRTVILPILNNHSTPPKRFGKGHHWRLFSTSLTCQPYWTQLFFPTSPSFPLGSPHVPAPWPIPPSLSPSSPPWLLYTRMAHFSVLTLISFSFFIHSLGDVISLKALNTLYLINSIFYLWPRPRAKSMLIYSTADSPSLLASRHQKLSRISAELLSFLGTPAPTTVCLSLSRVTTCFEMLRSKLSNHPWLLFIISHISQSLHQ